MLVLPLWPLKAKPLVVPLLRIVATPLPAASPSRVPRKRIDVPVGMVPLFWALAGTFAEAVNNSLAAWRRVVAGAAQNGIPTPAFSSSLAYYDGIRAERLPAALIQAQRDFFGAHTYRRVDKDGSFHTEWSADRTESQVGEAFKKDVPAATEAEKAPATSA